jgi:hypothetical protein
MTLAQKQDCNEILSGKQLSLVGALNGENSLGMGLKLIP